MNLRSLSLVCLVATLFLGFVIAAPPGRDRLYGIWTVFGGQDTETIAQTVELDPISGNSRALTNNFIYAGSSLTYDGISTLNSNDGIIYYATDGSSAFIWAVDYFKEQLAPPIDVGAAFIVDLKYNYYDKNLYFVFSDSTNAVLYGSYSSGKGPAQLIANFTDYLSTIGEVGEGTIGFSYGGAPSDYFFVSYGATNLINIYNGTTGTLTGVPLSNDCQGEKAFTYLQYDSSTGYVWGTQEQFRNSKIHTGLAVIDPATGQCTRTESAAFTQGVQGIITCLTYSEASSTLYFGVAPNGPGQLCSSTIGTQVGNFTLGAPTCVTVETVLADIAVDYH